jgi:hypothetical protein
MPLNSKGKKIKDVMKEEYGKEKGEQVFYASEKAGKFKDILKSKKEALLKKKRGSRE